MSVANAGYAGVAIFSRIRFTGFGEGVGDKDLDSEGRVAWVEFDKFHLYNIYAPNSGSVNNLSSMPKKLKFLKALSRKITNKNKPFCYVATSTSPVCIPTFTTLWTMNGGEITLRVPWRRGLR